MGLVYIISPRTTLHHIIATMRRPRETRARLERLCLQAQSRLACLASRVGRADWLWRSRRRNPGEGHKPVIAVLQLERYFVTGGGHGAPPCISQPGQSGSVIGVMGPCWVLASGLFGPRHLEKNDGNQESCSNCVEGLQPEVSDIGQRHHHRGCWGLRVHLVIDAVVFCCSLPFALCPFAVVVLSKTLLAAWHVTHALILLAHHTKGCSPAPRRALYYPHIPPSSAACAYGTAAYSLPPGLLLHSAAGLHGTFLTSLSLLHPFRLITGPSQNTSQAGLFKPGINHGPRSPHHNSPPHTQRGFCVAAFYLGGFS